MLSSLPQSTSILPFLIVLLVSLWKLRRTLGHVTAILNLERTFDAILITTMLDFHGIPTRGSEWIQKPIILQTYCTAGTAHLITVETTRRRFTTLTVKGMILITSVHSTELEYCVEGVVRASAWPLDLLAVFPAPITTTWHFSFSLQLLDSFSCCLSA